MALTSAHKSFQQRPANTDNTEIYPMPANTETRLGKFVACNTTGTEATFRLFVDLDGATYDQDSAIFYDQAIPPKGTFSEFLDLWLDAAAARVAIREGTPSAINFTLSVIEFTTA